MKESIKLKPSHGTGGQTMSREKQIEEMAKEISAGLLKQGQNWRHVIVAEHLYNAGYREQSEGCAFCEDADRLADLVCYIATDNGGSIDIPVRFCPNCGAKMKGESNEN